MAREPVPCYEMLIRRLTVVLLLLGAFVVVVSPASAGGSWLYPVQDRLESGDTATFVGYVDPGQLGWVDDGPFFAYLRVEPRPVDYAEGFPVIAESDVPLGRLEITEQGDLSLRVAITFTVPDELPPDEYALVYCNEPCTQGLGDLIGATVYVGFDNQFGAECRPWAFDEPEIVNLAPDTVVCGVDGDATAAQILAGEATTNEFGEVLTGPGTTAPASEGTAPPTEPSRDEALQQIREQLREDALANPVADSVILNHTNRIAAESDVVVTSASGRSWPAPATLIAVSVVAAVGAAFAIAAARRRRSGSSESTP